MTQGIEIQLGSESVVANAKQINQAFNSMVKCADNVKTAIVAAFAPVQSSLSAVHDAANKTKDELSAMADGLKQVGASAESNSNQTGFLDGITSGYETLKDVMDQMESIEKYSGKFHNVFADIATAPSITGLAESMFPKTSELLGTAGQWVKGSLVPAITDKMDINSGTIKESAANMLASLSSVFTEKGALIGEGLKSAGESIKGVFGGISSTFSGMSLGWGAAIAGIIALIMLLVTNWDTVKAALIAAWEAVQTALTAAVEWFNTTIIQPVAQFFVDLWTGITGWAANAWEFIKGVFTAAGAWFYESVIKPIADFFAGLWKGICDAIPGAWDSIKSGFAAAGAWFYESVIKPIANFFAGLWKGISDAAVSVWEAIKGAFAGAWEWFKSKVLDPITGGFKGMINGVIGFLNSLIGGIVKGINAVIGLLNKIRIDVPDAVPIIGGLSFGFDIPTMTAPQIPLLARGAVLPANKPFLALVGDQRHGTNVEAPLATIQQAVSLVMQQQSQRLEQRLLQSVQVQNQILEAVLGIEIGDSVIARAAERYRRKMAVVKGEYV